MSSPPTPISITGTVYNVDGTFAVGSHVIFNSRYTQVVNSGVIRSSSKTLLTDASGQITPTNFWQGENLTIQVDNGTPQDVSLPFVPTVDLSTLLAGIPLAPPTTVVTGINIVTGLNVAPGGDYQLSATNPVGGGPAVLTTGRVTGMQGIAWSYATAPPVSGSHVLGEIVWNSAPTADAFGGWICVAAGAPGTWKGFALISH